MFCEFGDRPVRRPNLLLENSDLMEQLPAPALASTDMIDHPELSERRRHAFARAQNHSRIVAVLKRVFPLFAVLCVSAYLLSGDFSVDYKDMKASVESIQLTKNELKMINPRLEGHDEKAGSYLVLADEASQKAGSPYIIHLKKINATLTHPDNGLIKLTALRGTFDSKAEILDLEGNIRIVGDDGLNARLERANIIFKEQLITSNEPVFIVRSGSTIDAVGMKFEGTKKHMTFFGPVRVRLIKSPKVADQKQ